MEEDVRPSEEPFVTLADAMHDRRYAVLLPDETSRESLAILSWSRVDKTLATLSILARLRDGGCMVVASLAKASLPSPASLMRISEKEWRRLPGIRSARHAGFALNVPLTPTECRFRRAYDWPDATHSAWSTGYERIELVETSRAEYLVVCSGSVKSVTFEALTDPTLLEP